MISTTYSQLTPVQQALTCLKLIERTQASEEVVQKVLITMNPYIKVYGGQVIIQHETLTRVEEGIRKESNV